MPCERRNSQSETIWSPSACAVAWLRCSRWLSCQCAGGGGGRKGAEEGGSKGGRRSVLASRCSLPLPSSHVVVLEHRVGLVRSVGPGSAHATAAACPPRCGSPPPPLSSSCYPRPSPTLEARETAASGVAARPQLRGQIQVGGRRGTERRRCGSASAAAAPLHAWGGCVGSRERSRSDGRRRRVERPKAWRRGHD